MPQIRGTELAERVRAIRPGIKVLFMSGYTDSGVVEHDLVAADAPYIQKPFTAAALRKKVREALQA
jgi:two-component SAPR family response regulator